ncbi:hypothetical protein [Pedobacter sp.]
MENRLEAELLRLQEADERFKKTFSFDMSSNKALSIERLRDYDRLIAKYGNTRDPRERLTIRVLKFERRRMEKQVYPNRLFRWFRKIFIIPVRRYNLERQERKLEQANKLSVSEQLNRIGLGEHYRRVEREMKNGEVQFTVPVSRHVKENEWINHNLSYERNSFGEYNLVSNRVQIVDETEPKKARQQIFKPGDGTFVDEQESYNLLNGRAIQRDGKWLKLDLNDRDTEGNYRVKEITSSFDVDRCLKDLGAKEWNSTVQREKLAADIRKGNRSQVTIGRKQYFVEANPQFKKIDIYDPNLQKISVAEVHGKKTVKESLAQNGSKVKVAKSSAMRMA